MKTIPKNSTTFPTWRPMKLAPPFEKTLAHIICPQGHETRLVSNVHSVGPDGTVAPSYVCTIPGCSFHEFIKLEGWTP